MLPITFHVLQLSIIAEQLLCVVGDHSVDHIYSINCHNVFIQMKSGKGAKLKWTKYYANKISRIKKSCIMSDKME